MDFSGLRLSAHLLFFSSFSYPIGIWFGKAFLYNHSFLIFSIHPLHSLHHIYRRELPGIAIIRPCLAGPEYLLGEALGVLVGIKLRRALERIISMAGQLQRRNTSNHVDSIHRSNIRVSGYCTLVIHHFKIHLHLSHNESRK